MRLHGILVPIEGHAELVEERLGARREIARDHGPLLAVQAQHRSQPADGEQHQQLALIERGQVHRAIQQGQRLHVEDLDVDRRELEQPHPLVDARPGDADGQDVVRDPVLGAAEHLGIEHRVAGRQKTQLAMLELERGQDLLVRQWRQRDLPDDHVGPAHRGDDGLPGASRRRQRGVDRLGELSGSRGRVDRPQGAARDHDLFTAQLEAERLDRSAPDVETNGPSLSKEPQPHRSFNDSPPFRGSDIARMADHLRVESIVYPNGLRQGRTWSGDAAYGHAGLLPQSFHSRPGVYQVCPWSATREGSARDVPAAVCRT